LIKGGYVDVDVKGEEEMTALHRAVRRGDLPLVQWLVKEGNTKLNATDVYGYGTEKASKFPLIHYESLIDTLPHPLTSLLRSIDPLSQAIGSRISGLSIHRMTQISSNSTPIIINAN
jgi:Ankyrin repeat